MGRKYSLFGGFVHIFNPSDAKSSLRFWTSDIRPSYFGSRVKPANSPLILIENLGVEMHVCIHLMILGGKPKASRRSRINFQKAKITHLCFADDLFLFYGGKPESATLLKQALDTFCALSGLSANE